MPDNKDSGGGGKSNANRYQGNHESFRAPTSGLAYVVFQPHSLAADFKKINDRLANHVGVTFKQMGLTMGKDMRKLVNPVLVVLIMPDRNLKSYNAEIIVFAVTYKLLNHDICELKYSNQKSYNLYKQQCAEAMMQKLTTLHDWKTVEKDMDRVGIANTLWQVCHKKGYGEKKQMLKHVQETKDDFMCW